MGGFSFVKVACTYGLIPCWKYTCCWPVAWCAETAIQVLHSNLTIAIHIRGSFFISFVFPPFHSVFCFIRRTFLVRLHSIRTPFLPSPLTEQRCSPWTFWSQRVVCHRWEFLQMWSWKGVGSSFCRLCFGFKVRVRVIWCTFVCGRIGWWWMTMMCRVWIWVFVVWVRFSVVVRRCRWWTFWRSVCVWMCVRTYRYGVSSPWPDHHRSFAPVLLFCFLTEWRPHWRRCPWVVARCRWPWRDRRRCRSRVSCQSWAVEGSKWGRCRGGWGFRTWWRRKGWEGWWGRWALWGRRGISVRRGWGFGWVSTRWVTLEVKSSSLIQHQSWFVSRLSFVSFIVGHFCCCHCCY